MDYPLIEFPSHALYVSLDTLFDLNADNQAGSPCQQAVREIITGLPELGIAPLKTTPFVLAFSGYDVYDSFVDLLSETSCDMVHQPPEPGFGLRETIDTAFDAIGEYRAADGSKSEVTFRIEPMPDSGAIKFENRSDFAQATVETLSMVYHRVGMVAAIGPKGYPLTNLRVTLLDVQFESPRQPLSSSSPIQSSAPPPRSEQPKQENFFFRMFDKLFDTIDQVFAGGTGTEFQSMPSGKSSSLKRESLWMATGDALERGFRDRTRLIAPVTRVQLRFPVEYSEKVKADFTGRGGEIEDEVHDGTTWTLTGNIPATALEGYEQVLKSLSAVSATVVAVDDLRYDPTDE